MKRRDMLILGGAVALVYGIRSLPWDRLIGRSPDYAPIVDLPPFRRLADQGQTLGAGISLAGLGSPSGDANARRALADVLRKNPCPALFGSAVEPGKVPIAYFSDFRCPYCRALEVDLDRLQAEFPGSFQIVQHELPIFGPTSELAARASVAASRQGRQQELRRRFMRTPLIAEDASVRRVATDLGMDTERLIRDMATPEVQAELDRTRALADIFGFIGTPGLVIGRTVLNGAIPFALLRRIGKDEKALSGVIC